MRITLFPPQAVHELGRRANQEDSIYPAQGDATPDDRLFVLCDGMGGHERGEVASSAVCEGLADYFLHDVKADEVLSDGQLQAALEHAYKFLDEKDNGEFRKAGTTMTLLCFHRGGCTAAHIGDSRIYHFRPSSREILYKSRDHSLVFELYQAGEITYREMKTHPRKNQISRAMIAGRDNRQRMDVVHIADIQPGDYFLICSDGVLEHIDDEELMDWLVADDDDNSKRLRLVEMTKRSADNHSAYLVHVANVQAEAGDETLADDEQTVRFNAVHIHPVLKAEDDVRIVPEENDEAEATQLGNLPAVETEGGQKRRAVWWIVGALCALVTIIILLLTFIL